MKMKIRVLQPIWLSKEERTVTPEDGVIEVDWTQETLDLVLQAGACEVVPSKTPTGPAAEPESKGPVQPEGKE